MVENAGIVDQCIEPAVAVEAGADHGLDVGFVGNIAGHAHRFVASGNDLVYQRFGDAAG